MNYSLPVSSVHQISQARILEWVAISISRGCSWTRDCTQIFCIGRWMLYRWTTREAQWLAKCKSKGQWQWPPSIPWHQVSRTLHTINNKESLTEKEPYYALVGMLASTMDKSREVPSKRKNRPTSRSSNPTSGWVYTWRKLSFKKTLVVTGAVCIIAKAWEQPKCPSTDEQR